MPATPSPGPGRPDNDADLHCAEADVDDFPDVPTRPFPRSFRRRPRHLDVGFEEEPTAPAVPARLPIRRACTSAPPRANPHSIATATRRAVSIEGEISPDGVVSGVIECTPAPELGRPRRPRALAFALTVAMVAAIAGARILRTLLLRA